MSMGSYPTSYDLRTYNRVTSVKDQGTCGDCWAYGAMSSLESSLMPTENRDFYEGDLNANSGFDYGSCNGGNNEMSAAYFARWSGPLNEGTSSPVQKHVQDVIYLPPRSGATDNDNFKSAIMNYGGISASFYWNSAYLSSSGYYYPSGGSGNHMITIAGWDDSHAVSGAPGVGAFLCKNSWGSTWDGDGYFWISYYDGILGHEEQAVFHDAEPTTNYDTVYQYDPLGESIDYGYSSTTGWAANIFTASSNQAINSVGFYTTDVNCAYTVYVYSGVTSGPRTGTLQSTTTGTIPYAGYHTVSINPVQVQNGQKFSVVVKLTNPSSHYTIALEYPLSGYSTGARASSGQSYVSSDGNSWSDITSSYANTNVCIKAFGGGTGSKVTPADPAADFNATPLNGINPLTVQFNDNSTGSVPTSWNWSFGDNTPNATVQNPVHTYANPGLYTVNLTVTNSYGSGSIQKTNYINVTSPPAFLDGWSYRKLHTIAGHRPGSLTNYQVKFTVWNTTGTDNGENVYLGNKVKPDYSDLRINGNRQHPDFILYNR